MSAPVPISFLIIYARENSNFRDPFSELFNFSSIFGDFGEIDPFDPPFGTPFESFSLVKTVYRRLETRFTSRLERILMLPTVYWTPGPVPFGPSLPFPFRPPWFLSFRRVFWGSLCSFILGPGFGGWPRKLEGLRFGCCFRDVSSRSFHDRALFSRFATHS